jgi:hypothetical protein
MAQRFGSDKRRPPPAAPWAFGHKKRVRTLCYLPLGMAFGGRNGVFGHPPAEDLVHAMMLTNAQLAPHVARSRPIQIAFKPSPNEQFLATI